MKLSRDLVKSWIIGIGVSLAIVGMVLFVLYLRQVSKEQEQEQIAIAEVKEEHRQRCRLNIGLHPVYGNEFQKLAMACAHESISQDLAKGISRGEAANRAWHQCMPNMSDCEEALK